MRWRDVIIGAISALVVAIISGLVINYFTNRDKQEPAEILGYSVEQSGSFESENNRVALVNVALYNAGNDNATNVLGSIEFPFGVIKDKQINASSGKVSGFQIESESNKFIKFTIPSLLPGERVSISFLLEASSIPKPKISLKSDKSIGKAISLLFRPEEKKESIAKYLVSLFIPLSAVLAIIISLLFLSKFGSSRRGYVSSINSVGFVCLHTGLIELAGELLLKALSQGEHASYSLSNYATWLEINKRSGDANKFLAAASFIAKAPREKAIVEFNRTIIMLMRPDLDEAKKSLQKALKLSRREVKYLCENSALYKNNTHGLDEFTELINR